MQTHVTMRSASSVTGLVLLAACSGPSLSLKRDGAAITVVRDGADVATVYAAASPRPYVWPVLAPSGIPVTRNHPMWVRENEQHDHPHHKSLWFAHGSVNGYDFWQGVKHHEQILHVTTETQERSGGEVEVVSEYKWQVEGGRVIMREQRSMTFTEQADYRTIDVAFKLMATEGDVLFGDTKEGTFAMRLHPSLRVEGKIANGTLTDSEGRLGKEVWGKRARWIHDYGRVGGDDVGVAIFDHPTNLRHPTWWHARTYGLLAANPFGKHDFQGGPSGGGDFMLKKGEEMTLRYQVLVHYGAWSPDRLENLWKEWAR
ncbi:MAG: hypothetical protein CMJ88_10100 [Planctomycetes bacterium]|nr:hypothetical protein [Planctomycetota bacterium]